MINFLLTIFLLINFAWGEEPHCKKNFSKWEATVPYKINWTAERLELIAIAEFLSHHPEESDIMTLDFHKTLLKILKRDIILAEPATYLADAREVEKLKRILPAILSLSEITKRLLKEQQVYQLGKTIVGDASHFVHHSTSFFPWEKSKTTYSPYPFQGALHFSHTFNSLSEEEALTLLKISVDAFPSILAHEAFFMASVFKGESKAKALTLLYPKIIHYHPSYDPEYLEFIFDDIPVTLADTIGRKLGASFTSFYIVKKNEKVSIEESIKHFLHGHHNEKDKIDFLHNLLSKVESLSLSEADLLLHMVPMTDRWGHRDEGDIIDLFIKDLNLLPIRPSWPTKGFYPLNHLIAYQILKLLKAKNNKAPPEIVSIWEKLIFERLDGSINFQRRPIEYQEDVKELFTLLLKQVSL